MIRQSDKQVKELRSRVFRHMLDTRSWKYRAFLRYLRFFRYVAFSSTRGEFLESYYTLMRYLDDIVDGDLSLPEGFPDQRGYLSEKIAFSLNPVNPKDEVDNMIIYCFELAKRFGEDFKAETRDILDSLMFDANRRGKWTIFPREDLNHHFHLLDIRGTIRATLKVFKDDPDKYKILEPLGRACRYQYDIEDFESDIAVGYVNISKEECEQFSINRDDLDKLSSPKIRSWLSHHASQGMALLSDHHRLMQEGKFSLLEKAVFKVVYVMPARKVFRKILSES